MEITYSPDIDAMNITLNENEIVKTIEYRPHIYFDLDAEGNIVNIEIHTASNLVAMPGEIHYMIFEAAKKVSS